MTDIISPYLEILLYITSIRQQIYPRTTYNTSGNTSKILNIITDNFENIDFIKKEIIDKDEFNSFHISSFEKNTYLNNHITLIDMFSNNLDVEIKYNYYKEKLEFAKNQIQNSYLSLVILLVHNSYIPSINKPLETDIYDITTKYSQPLGPNKEYHIISLYKKVSLEKKIILGNNGQPHVHSRSQFKFLWDNNYNQRVLQRIANKECNTETGIIKYSETQWNNFIKKWLSNGLDDFGIYSNIRKYTLGNSIKLLNNNEGRNEHIVKIIKECIPSYININNYLDYGCAEGNITALMGKKLNLESTNIYGADIRSIPNDGFNFIELNSENKDIPPEPNNILPTIQNNSISIITCCMVMHHVKYPLETFRELRRIIRNDGCLVLREHHCDSIEMATFLDIVHGLYSLSWSNPIEWPLFLDEYEANYKSQTEWNKIVFDAGFKRVTKQEYYKINSKLKKDGKISNINQVYFATYIPV